MDYEDVGNLNFTFDEDITPSQSMQYIAHEIIFTLFSIVGICADAAIIYIIFRFQRLRTTENIFLANWAIADLCSLIVAPSGYRLLSIIDNLSLSQEFMCILLQVGGTLHVLVIQFVIVVSIDWLIAAYFEEKSEKFRSYYKYIIGSTWIVALLYSGVGSGLCIRDKYVHFLVASPLFWSISAVLLMTIALQCSRAVRKYHLKRPLEYPTLMLTLTSAFAGCWLPGYIIFMIFETHVINQLLSLIVECGIFGSSIVNLILLYRFNEDFNACLLQALKRGKYEESICNFDNPIVKNTEKGSVNVSFENLDEELLKEAY